MSEIAIANWNTLEPGKPAYALVGNVDLVVIRWPDEQKASVLYGRCQHRGALLADGYIDGDNLICSLHGWDYRYKGGVSEYNNKESLHKFRSWIEDNKVWVDEREITKWEKQNPQPYKRDDYQGLYQDFHGGEEETHVQAIQQLAQTNKPDKHDHGEVASMGVPVQKLPHWDDIQFLTAQLHRFPLEDDAEVGTQTVIGQQAQQPLALDIPLFVTDMSFGALSQEAKLALAIGAEMAGTGICSGEGGMLPEEQQANSRYFYEYASGRFGFNMDKLKRCQAFHFKLGQATKTGTGGLLPGAKVTARIAEIRGIAEGEAVYSPARIPYLETLDDYRRFAEEVREATSGIPIGVKISAQHIEEDIEAALKIGVDYIILDGRGGGTGASALLFRDHISVPTIPALARARRYLDEYANRPVSLVVTGGLRTPPDFLKALALGADAIALGNAALQAIGCLGMRACHTNKCPVGIATQDIHFRRRLLVEKSAAKLNNFFRTSTHLMQVMARACGHTQLQDFSKRDLTTWNRDMALLTGIAYAGFGAVDPQPTARQGVSP
ncbi:glutamate synthase-related protein [Thiothrix nivea]|uniref:Ferredoxin-dependent glutamate synthase n=1 Tax=Thiothrix nivea (strain ATCC 35100 / DSM 5205 / JP2) TaxID=870187 RepID=A0A656HMA9_THINJ|nr:glutamate synthase-related protein [Thiothrix nivea]EIJ36449.1 ferredoxin-dependent glutamate synthase [Thiothrix nivea DSM 5205]